MIFLGLTPHPPLRADRAYPPPKSSVGRQLHYVKFLGTNVWAGGNELDLIARRGRELRFVEVKEKRGPTYGDPVAAVTSEKQRRVRRAADTWLAARPELDGLSVAFDVVTR